MTTIIGRNPHWRSAGDAGAAAVARHCTRLKVSGVVAEQPTLLLLRRGHKRITWGGRSITLEAGQAVMVPMAKAYDLVSSPVGGEFIATLLSPAQHLVAAIAAEYPVVPALLDARAIHDLEPDFLACFERAVAAHTEPNAVPAKVVESRVREVLVWLAHKGLRFGLDRHADLAQRSRALLAQDLERPWTIKELAALVAMSEATFRRRLGEQGLSFRELLIDVRMTRALALLQVTDLSIGQIALSVGYDSASRFAARFRSRFSFLPSAVRASHHGR